MKTSDVETKEMRGRGVKKIRSVTGEADNREMKGGDRTGVPEAYQAN